MDKEYIVDLQSDAFRDLQGIAFESLITSKRNKLNAEAIKLLKAAYDLIGQAEMRPQSTLSVLGYATKYDGEVHDGFDWLDDVRDFLENIGEAP